VQEATEIDSIAYPGGTRHDVYVDELGHHGVIGIPF
jgi:hypothetical protein